MRIFGLLGLLIMAGLIAWWATTSLKTTAPQQQAATQEAAIAAAKALYLQQKSAGTDFSDGPCLSNEVVPGWVADIAHDPRQSIDDLPQNQCSAYREGQAKHFVELDLNGNLIRSQ